MTVSRTIVVLLILVLLGAGAHSQAADVKLSTVGTVRGVIERTESDKHGLFAVFFRIKGRMHQFMVRDAKLVGGTIRDIRKGKLVEIKFRHREHSEMDGFYTADATVVRFVGTGKGRKSK